MDATLTRTHTGNSGTFGSLVLEDGTTYATGELPWRNNATGLSCIPAGAYPCAIYNSPAHGPVFQVLDVPGRDYIEIHAANFFGDKKLGLRCDMLGCIGLGQSLGAIGGQDAVVGSRVAVADFMRRQGVRPFRLTIVDHTPRGECL